MPTTAADQIRVKKLGVGALVLLAVALVGLAALGSTGTGDDPVAPTTTTTVLYGTPRDFATLTGRIGAVYPGVPLATVQQLVAETCQDIARGKLDRAALVDRVRERLEGGNRPPVPVEVAEVVLTGLEQIPNFCTIRRQPAP